MIFQSTQPEWAATNKRVAYFKDYRISIHAARVGCDHLVHSEAAIILLFQSTQPEWAATYMDFFNDILGGKKFQSTQPEWAATIIRVLLPLLKRFQSTQPEWAATWL